MQRLIWMLYPSGLQPYIAFDNIIGHSEHVHDAHLKMHTFCTSYHFHNNFIINKSKHQTLAEQ